MISLENTKKGDEVRHFGVNGLNSIKEVSRVTPRQIVLTNGEKFGKFAGRPVGSTKTGRFIEPA